MSPRNPFLREAPTAGLREAAYAGTARSKHARHLAGDSNPRGVIHASPCLWPIWTAPSPEWRPSPAAAEDRNVHPARSVPPDRTAQPVAEPEGRRPPQGRTLRERHHRSDGRRDQATLPRPPTVLPPAPRPRRVARSGTGLDGMVLAELQQVASGLGIRGTARMRKSQLIEVIKEAQAGGAPAKPRPLPHAEAPAAADAAPAAERPTKDAPGTFPPPRPGKSPSRRRRREGRGPPSPCVAAGRAGREQAQPAEASTTRVPTVARAAVSGAPGASAATAGPWRQRPCRATTAARAAARPRQPSASSRDVDDGRGSRGDEQPRRP